METFLDIFILMKEIKQKNLDQILTYNLMENGIVPERIQTIIDNLVEARFTPNRNVVMSFQEVRKEKWFVMWQVARALGFGIKNNLRFYPSRGQNYGNGFITNMEILRDKNTLLSPGNPEAMEQGAAILEINTPNTPTIIVNLHLTFRKNYQIEQAMQAITSLKQFIIDSLSPQTRWENQHLDLLTTAQLSFDSNRKILLVGDTNGYEDTKVFQYFESEGFEDLTKPLENESNPSWPVDINWYLEINKNHWKKNSDDLGYDIYGEARNVDKIYAFGIIPLSIARFGDKPGKNGYFGSDHFGYKAFFTQKQNSNISIPHPKISLKYF